MNPRKTPHCRESFTRAPLSPRGWAVIAALAHAVPCLAQATSPATAPAAAPTTQPAPPAQTQPMSEAQLLAEDNELALMRPPLLRESSHLVEARGVMKRDPDTNWWMFELQPQDIGFAAFGETADLPPYELVLLPTTTLSEMQRVFESTAGTDGRVMFQVTGQVLVYRGRNYALINHAGRLAREAVAPAAPPAAETSHASAQPTTAPATQPAATGDSIDDIKRGLEQSLNRAPEHLNASETSSLGEHKSGPASLGFTVDAAALNSATASAHGTEKAMREGSAVQSRRGKITRDSAGAWLFIFDADATGDVTSAESIGATQSAQPAPQREPTSAGGGDPPMRLLPCLLLEKIEDYARRNPSTAPVLITGEVFLYQGRNYLLPTVFRIPQERTKIAP